MNPETPRSADDRTTSGAWCGGMPISRSTFWERPSEATTSRVLGGEEVDLDVAADPLPAHERLGEERGLVGRSRALERQRRDEDANRSFFEVFERGMDPRATVRCVEVVCHLLEAGHRLGCELRAEGDQERVVGEIAPGGPHDLVAEVELLDFCLMELDALSLKTVQGPAELLFAALTHHLPEQRRLVAVLGAAIDEHDAVPVRDAPLKLARRDEATGAAAQDDGAAGGCACSVPRRLRDGWLLEHPPDCSREPCLVELVLGEDDLAVRPDQDAPGNPAVGEGAKQGAVDLMERCRLFLILALGEAVLTTATPTSAAGGRHSAIQEITMHRRPATHRKAPLGHTVSSACHSVPARTSA
jgi:hypothetical protein